MKTLFILNDPPYGTERSYNALRLTRQLLKAGAGEVKVFLIGDAVACAKAGQKVPAGYYNAGDMLGMIARTGGEIGVCGTCIDARGISVEERSKARRAAAWRCSRAGRSGRTRSSPSEEDAMSHTALILGAGIGGIVAAQTLRKLLPAADRVIAVDRAERHLFQPSLLWLMTGARSPADFTRPLARIAGQGVEMLRGAVTRIDPARREAQIDGQTIAADALIIALGADYAPDAIPGLAQAGMNLYTLEGATAIRDALARFKAGRIIVLTAAPAYKCPAAPYEAAMLIDAYLRQHGLRDKAAIEFFAAEPRPMFVAGPEIGAAVRGMIEARGIAYHPEHQVKDIDAQARRIAFANGAETNFDLLIYVPPHRAPVVVHEAGLTNDSGWIPVDRHTLQTRFDNVYALGDVTTIPLKMGRPLPKAGVFAHGQAEVVAHNIAHAWTGLGAARRFDGHGMCFIETGNARAGLGKGNFYAEPTPQVQMRGPNLFWHLGKIVYEKYWLYRRF